MKGNKMKSNYEEVLMSIINENNYHKEKKIINCIHPPTRNCIHSAKKHIKIEIDLQPTFHYNRNFMVRESLVSKLPKITNKSDTGLLEKIDVIKNRKTYDNATPTTFFQPKKILYSNKSKKTFSSILKKSYYKMHQQQIDETQRNHINRRLNKYKPSEFGEIYCDLIKDRHKQLHSSLVCSHNLLSKPKNTDTVAHKILDEESCDESIDLNNFTGIDLEISGMYKKSNNQSRAEEKNIKLPKYQKPTIGRILLEKDTYYNSNAKILTKYYQNK